MDAGVEMWHGWTGLEKSMGRIWRLGGDFRRREKRDGREGGWSDYTHLLDGVARAFCGMEATTGFSFLSLILSLCRQGALGYHCNLVGRQAG